MNFKTYLFTCLCITQGILSFSQNSDSTKYTIIRFHIVVPGLTLEQKVSNSFSVSYDIGSGFEFYYYNINGSSSSSTAFYPYLRLEPRYYLDLNRRNQEKKVTDFLAANYFAIQFKRSFPSQKSERWYSYGFVLGIQRTLKNTGYFDIGIGYAGITSDSKTTVGLIGNFHFGFILNANN